MPIRFRCAYCNQLMGISHRKMGTVVRCPKCTGQVVVPHVAEAPAETSGTPGQGGVMKLLEGPELEMLLAAANESPAGQKSKPTRKGSPLANLEFDVEPVELSPAPLTRDAPPAAPPAPKGTVGVPAWLVGSLAGVMLLLLGLVFLVGFLLGKQFPK